MSDLIQLGAVQGYLAKPAGAGPFPAVIVIQEWWGLDAQTKSVADRFASEGYLAFAPDVYHGELAKPGDGDTAMKLVQKYGPNAPAELTTIFDALKSLPDCSGKIGSVGFCFGGRMSLSLSASRPLDAVCTFYGGGMQTIFDQLRANLKAPVLGFFGDADVSIPVGTVEEFDKLLGGFTSKGFVEQFESRLVSRLGLDVIARGANQPRQRFAHRIIVVDQKDRHAGVSIFSSASANAGNSTWNVAPPSWLFSAHKRPPWASTIDRLMDNPMPSPSLFVVKNG